VETAPLTADPPPPPAGDCGGSASVSFELVTDGTCRQTEQYDIAYNVICNADGSATRNYFGDGSKNPNCTPPQTPQHYPAGACASSLPELSGLRITCSSDNKAAKLEFWQATAPSNQTIYNVTMKDGTYLTTEVYYPPFMPFPSTGYKGGVATLYTACPYDTQSALGGFLAKLPAEIDAVVHPVTKIHFNAVGVLQQQRGLYTSGLPNENTTFDDARHTKSDAGDTGQWILNSNFSNGVIMTTGISAMGMAALIAADATPPLPTVAGWYSIMTNDLREAFFKQGAFMVGVFGSILGRPYLPPDQMPRAPLAAHESDGPDPYWEPVKMDKFEKIRWPTLVRSAWFDMFQKGGIRTGNGIYAKARCGAFRLFKCTTTLIVDALGHAGLDGIPDFKGAYPVNGTAQNATQAYEGALSALLLFTFQNAKNQVLMDGLSVFYGTLMKLIPDKIVYVYGRDYLTSFSDWPAVHLSDYYTTVGGQIVTSSPSAANQSYVYDPADPAPTIGGTLFSGINNGLGSYGSADQSPNSHRPDVLQFNTAPLEDDLALCGAVKAFLTVSSSANDTDFIVKLVDQNPSGERYLITEGIIRMRWREKQLTPTMMEPGVAYPVEIDMWNTCWIIKAGHRVGLDITSSSSYLYLPNPNTGGPLQADGIWPRGGEYYTGENVTATNTIIFGASKLQLPVVDKADLPVMGPLIIPTPTAVPSDEELVEMANRR